MSDQAPSPGACWCPGTVAAQHPRCLILCIKTTGPVKTPLLPQTLIVNWIDRQGRGNRRQKGCWLWMLPHSIVHERGGCCFHALPAVEDSLTMARVLFCSPAAAAAAVASLCCVCPHTHVRPPAPAVPSVHPAPERGSPEYRQVVYVMMTAVLLLRSTVWPCWRIGQAPSAANVECS